MADGTRAPRAGIVVRNFPRHPAAKLAPLAQFGVATVHEAIGRRGYMATYMRPIYPGAAIAGSAVTVSVAPGDNTMIHVAIEFCRPGDVLVVAPTSPCTDGYFGELLGTQLKHRGVLGLVIDAGVRDVKPLTDMRFPVWSRAVSAQGTVKETLGNVNLPLICAGERVDAGDVIIADDDGVMVLPYGKLDEGLKASQARTDKEAQSRARFEAGAMSLDLSGMREKLIARGLTYVEDLAELGRKS
jgi:4-hydroxy-4-methyl-2-oxoglutarate aldolase